MPNQPAGNDSTLQHCNAKPLRSTELIGIGLSGFGLTGFGAARNPQVFLKAVIVPRDAVFRATHRVRR